MRDNGIATTIKNTNIDRFMIMPSIILMMFIKVLGKNTNNPIANNIDNIMSPIIQVYNGFIHCQGG